MVNNKKKTDSKSVASRGAKRYLFARKSLKNLKFPDTQTDVPVAETVLEPERYTAPSVQDVVPIDENEAILPASRHSRDMYLKQQCQRK